MLATHSFHAFLAMVLTLSRFLRLKVMLLLLWLTSGDVRIEDLVGNDGADTAADLGRLRQHDDVITARRNLLRVRRLWYPIILGSSSVYGCCFSY